ncbi:MAG: hypothetical protein BAA01_07420 [Bacillus thermozeamaize]|jgi:hypothetical protein|uniref:Uncharacterized protein n=1 Tax=Bacillus thermozeamaize TaxID=230954 RepID=A0A1Y3Q059_9BACI|nr:MAG: hypothetical protein BAA01_07420 [Bacillus thermozeamaize]
MEKTFTEWMIKVKKTLALNKLFSIFSKVYFSVMWRYALTLLALFFLLITFKPLINQFLIAHVPDAGTKDLDVNYVLSNLPLLFWVSFLALVLCLVLCVKHRNIHFFFTALLFLYSGCYFFVRNIYEIYILAIDGPYPHYGSSQLGMAHLIILALAFLSLVAETAYLKRVHMRAGLKSVRFITYSIWFIATVYYLYPFIHQFINFRQW